MMLHDSQNCAQIPTQVKTRDDDDHIAVLADNKCISIKYHRIISITRLEPRLIATSLLSHETHLNLSNESKAKLVVSSSKLPAF